MLYPWLHKKAFEYSRDISYAMAGDPFTALLTKDRAINAGLGAELEIPYTGQSTDTARDPKQAEILNTMYGVASNPDLPAVFAGHISPENAGLKVSNVKPSREGGYPWKENAEIYDITKYTAFNAFIGHPEQLITLKYKVDDLGPNEIISHKELLRFRKKGVELAFHTSVDLGLNFNWSIGKDSEGNAYVALADAWDFESMKGPAKVFGVLMERYGKGKGVKDIGFYGRFPLKSTDFILPEQFNEHMNRKYGGNN